MLSSWPFEEEFSPQIWAASFQVSKGFITGGWGGERETGEVAWLRHHLCLSRLGNFTYHIPVSSSTPLHLSLTLQMK